jgi:hypothetical protein
MGPNANLYAISTFSQMQMLTAQAYKMMHEIVPNREHFFIIIYHKLLEGRVKF